MNEKEYEDYCERRREHLCAGHQCKSCDVVPCEFRAYPNEKLPKNKEYTHIVTFMDREERSESDSYNPQYEWVFSLEGTYSIEKARQIKERILNRKDQRDPKIYEVKVVE